MNHTRRLLCIVSALVASAASSGLFAGVPSAGTTGAVHQPKDGDFTFSLLPKAFQRSPDLEMTVNTEVTPYGALLRKPTPENPTFYLAYDAGFKPMGDTIGGEHPPKPEAIDRTMHSALAQGGYLLSTAPEQRPTLMIIYFWGSHNRMDRETESQFPALAAKHRLERAMLVGGHPQVEKMSRALEWGESLTDRTPEYEYLRDQSNDDLYYVVASAYDYNALAHKERKLVWRTTMTVNARGVSMQESMMPLIETAGPFFGREMKQPEIASRRVERWGVRIGESKVIESDVALPGQTKPTAPTSAPPAKK
jgi:hypothetical protein